jgi:ribosomal protein S12 methylthiotransferase accessory factor
VIGGELPLELSSDLFERAASMLTAQDQLRDAEAQALLAALEYRPSPSEAEDPSSPIALRAHRAALLRMAGKFERVFRLRSPAAPGLICLGAELSPELAGALHRGAFNVSVSGVGMTLQAGFQACIGEGIEYLSQLEIEGEAIEIIGAAEILSKLNERSQAFVTEVMQGAMRNGARAAWCRARRLSDRSEILLPAEICWRRPKARQLLSPPFLLGTGTAAGESYEAAALHGLLELIERDAAGLWWRGGRRARMIALDDEGWRMATTLIADLRRGPSRRRSWVLDITTDVGVPCAAALSCSPDGFGLAFGLSARLSMRDAMRSAILEMCQIELAYAVVEAKLLERGTGALNERDLAHLQRAVSIDAEHCALLHALPPNPASTGEGTTGSPPLQSIVSRLAELGIEVFAIDLQRAPFGVPAVRVIAPGLQLEPSNMTTERLRAAILEAGGGETYTKGERLL